MYRSDSDYLTKPFLTDQQGNVKLLMQTFRLHVIAILKVGSIYVYSSQINIQNEECCC